MNSFNFNIELAGFDADNKKNLDIYFQPALTWIDDIEPLKKTQGVAMLFLENKLPILETGEEENEDHVNQQDFREMVKYLVQWVWVASGKEETAHPTLDELIDTFEDFANESMSYDVLENFLEGHFNFRIQKYEDPNADELEATVFPMFPHLYLKIGEGDPKSFSPDDKKLDQPKINRLKGLNQKFKSRFDPNAENPSTISADFIPEFIFTGYFRMLVRSGLQELINYLEKNEVDLADPTLKNLLQLISNERYENIAGMASTFLLNGFRVPANTFAPNSDEMGLYTATGQQFIFEESLNEKESTYQITLSNPNDLSYLKPKDPNDSEKNISFNNILYEVTNVATDPLYKTSQELKAVIKDDFPAIDLKLINFYKDQQMNFALRQSINWNDGVEDTDLLLLFPNSLKSHLLSVDRSDDPKNNRMVDLHLWPTGKHEQEISVKDDNFTWVTMIKFTVQRIPDSEGKGFMAHTYELVEGSDDDLNLLEDIFEFLSTNGENDPIDLYLAYAPDGSDTADLTSLEPAVGKLPTHIYRSNLSTNTSIELTSDYSATLSRDPNNKVPDTKFLQLIWEGCTVATGGYFLHVQHYDADLEESWFKGESIATVHLIIEFTNTDDLIHNFNNAVRLKKDYTHPDTNIVDLQSIDMENDLVLARSEAIIPVLVIPPGHIGFKVDDRVSPEDDPDSAVDEAKHLYHMLGFGLGTNDDNNSDFETLHSSIPIGPTIIKLKDENENETENWLYERLIPAFSLWKNPDPQVDSNLPLLEKDPYLGINKNSNLPIECWWQDIYGNSLQVKKSTAEFPVKYTDPLIGLNQWPSVNENFCYVEVDEKKIALELEFSFDVTGYPNPAAPEKTTDKQKKRLESDIITYQKIYYQLIQKDINLSMNTSVDTKWSISTVDGLDNDNLIGFVVSIYQYLNHLTKGNSVLPPDSYKETFLRLKTEVLLPVKFIFEVDVQFTISRDIQYIHDSLKKKDNGEVISEIQDKHLEVLSNTALLTPKIDAQGATDTIQNFAFNFEQAFPDLRLAVSENRIKKKSATDTGRPFFAVRLGTDQGISYDISEANPAYFSLPPLANTLLEGNVPVDDYLTWKAQNPSPTGYAPDFEEKQFEAIDINVLAREFLVAVEDFLTPESMITAMQLDTANTEAILTLKSTLASEISNKLDVILEEDRNTGSMTEAIEAMKQELLIHLVKGYDIETAVQFEVAVTVGNSKLTNTWTDAEKVPRVKGVAIVKNIWQGEDPKNLTLLNQNDLDFSLYAGKIDLKKETSNSTFTYLFDTKTPEKFASIHLELEFRLTEIEYEIEDVPGITGFQASNWLTLVIPENLNRYAITTSKIDDAKSQLTINIDTLSRLEQVLTDLKDSDNFTDEYLTKEDLEAVNKNLIGSEFKKQILDATRPVYGISQTKLDEVLPDLEAKITEQTTLINALTSLKESQFTKQIFSTQDLYEEGLETTIGSTNYNKLKDSILKYSHPFFKIKPSIIDSLNLYLDDLIANGEDLVAIKTTLNNSNITELEFLSENGTDTGLRKIVGKTIYTDFKNQLPADDLPIFTSSYGLDIKEFNRLNLELSKALDTRQLFKKALEILKKSEFLSRLDFELAVKKELGSFFYEKYIIDILSLTQLFYQITDGRLNVLEKDFENREDENPLLGLTRKIRSSSLKGRKFPTATDFETELVKVIKQEEFDQFRDSLLAYFNPFKITDSLLRQFVIEKNDPDEDEYNIVFQSLKSIKLYNTEFAKLDQFKSVAINSIGAVFFRLFKDLLQPFIQPVYKISGAMMDSLDEVVTSTQAEHSRVEKAIANIESSFLIDKLMPLKELDQSISRLLGERRFPPEVLNKFPPEFPLEFLNELKGFGKKVYQIAGARLDLLAQKFIADSTPLLQVKEGLSTLSIAKIPVKEFQSREELEDAMIESLGSAPFVSFREQVMLLGLLEKLDEPDFGIFSPLVETALNLLDGNAVNTDLYSPSEFITALKEGIPELPGIPEVPGLTAEEYESLQTELQTYAQPVYRVTKQMIVRLAKQAALIGSQTFEDKLAELNTLELDTLTFSSSSKLNKKLNEVLNTTDVELFQEQQILFNYPIFQLTASLLDQIGDENGNSQEFLEFRTLVENANIPDTEFLSVDELDTAIGNVPNIEDAHQGFRDDIKRLIPPKLQFTNLMLLIADELLAEVENEKADITLFKKLLTALALDPIKTKEYSSFEDMEDDIEAQSGTDDYQKFKEQLVNFAQPFYRLEGTMLDALLLEGNDDITNQTPYDVLEKLKKSLTKATEHVVIEELETALETVLGEDDYKLYRGQILNHARPIYRLKGKMLDGINEKVTEDSDSIDFFKGNLNDLKALPVEDREYTTLEEFEIGFRQAISENDFATQELRFQMFKNQMLAFFNPVFLIEEGWITDIENQLDSKLSVLDPIGKALEQLRFGDFHKEGFTTVDKFETALETDLEKEALETGVYAKIKVHLLSLSESVLKFTIPETLINSDDEEEFKKVTDVLIKAGLNGRNFDSEEQMLDEIFESLGASDYLLFRNLLPMFINSNYMGKSPIPIPLQDYPTPPSLIQQEAGVDESSRTDLEDIRQWEYVIVYEHENIAQDNIDCLIELNTLPVAITLSKHTVEEVINAHPPVDIGIISVTDTKGNNYTKADFLIQNDELGIFEIEDINNKPTLRLKKNAIVDQDVHFRLDFTIVAIDPSDNTKTRRYSQDFSLKVVPSGSDTITNDNQDLFQALVNFNENYPEIAKDLALFKDEEGDMAIAGLALLAFKTLADKVTTAWTNWNIIPTEQEVKDQDMHFIISEEPFGVAQGNNGESLQKKQGFIFPQGEMLKSNLGADDPEPLLALPGFKQIGDPKWSELPPMKTFEFEEDPLDQTFFGDSLIPDRKFTVENLDVIEHQNAWAGIWLSRNKILLEGHKTNPKFIFQTPLVKFTNRVSPFITNDEPWDLATLHSPDDQPEHKPLLEHMELMLGLIAPDITGLPVNYEVRLSCRYAFALVEGSGLNVDLQSTLPLLMGLRLNPTDTVNDQSSEKLLAAYPKILTDEINLWLELNKPSKQNASLIFTVNLFSKLDKDSMTSLPMLRIKHLGLKLKNIL